MTFPDLIGLVGVALIAVAYLLLQCQKWASTDRVYSAANAIGAALILVSLIYDFNLSAALIEGFWLIVSLYGLLRTRSPNSPDITAP